MTVCKKRMYTKYPQILIDYFHPQHMDTMVNYETVKSWVKEHTHNRSTLFKRLSHKTLGESTQYTCNTVSGDDIGKPCSFPFVFPDCSVKAHNQSFCSANTKSRIHYECTDEAGQSPWCSTRNYLNDTYIFGACGYCDINCSVQGLEQY